MQCGGPETSPDSGACDRSGLVARSARTEDRFPILALALGGILSVASSGCVSSGPAGFPPEVHGIPWQGGPGDAEVLEARVLADQGRELAALELVEEALAIQPRHVDAHRLRQDIFRERGRLGRLRVEARQRLEDWDGAASAHYLAGRVAADAAGQRAAFERCLEVDPELFWGWLGYAYSWRRSDPQLAAGIYDALYRRSQAHPVVAIGFGAALRAIQRHDDAIKVYAGLRGAPALPGVGDLGIAESHLGADRRREAWAPLLSAVGERPYDPGVHRLCATFLAAGLPDTQVEQLLDAVVRDPEVADAFVASGGGGVLASLLDRHGDLAAALEVLRSTPTPRSPGLRRTMRRVQLALGDVRGMLEGVRRSLPDALLEDERNQLRGLWSALWTGPWAVDDDPLGDPGHAVGLVRALRDVGLLEEAELVASQGLFRHRAAPGTVAALIPLREELRRELAFEHAMRTAVYRGYETGADVDLEQFLADLAAVSERILGRDVVGDPDSFEVPLVGQLVDPFGPGLAQHFARYNRHLVLGRRAGGVVEALVMTRVSLLDLDDGGPLGLEGQTREVIGIDRGVEALQGLIGGDLAGVALLNHYVLDLDAVRDWADDLVEQRQIVRVDGGALLDDPVPAGADPLDPVDVPWRFAALSPIEDSEVFGAVLDTVRWHERAHLVDSFRYLPPDRNLFRVISLAFEHGFDALAVESSMEGRAETAALAFGAFPHIVLAHVTGFLEQERPDSPHAQGFRELARRLNEGLASLPEHADRARVSSWHEVPVEVFQSLARQLAASYWR